MCLFACVCVVCLQALYDFDVNVRAAVFVSECSVFSVLVQARACVLCCVLLRARACALLHCCICASMLL